MSEKLSTKHSKFDPSQDYKRFTNSSQVHDPSKTQIQCNSLPIHQQAWSQIPIAIFQQSKNSQKTLRPLDYTSFAIHHCSSVGGAMILYEEHAKIVLKVSAGD
ncbi:hypothetical protein KC19_10G031100 [Ceratodon purpureus]|uniref:Uncharacterized protein n=1 Tax=Ceratodon purpureus TaxID=3225 RepID=A0A8T0GIR7_CERPU|nr:hypothetical protein KC19_10G031100 [Ceratodon purpureus]